MTTTIKAVAKNLVNLVYPLRCASCGQDLEAMDTRGVCGFCLDRIRLNPRPFCIRCGRAVEKTASLCEECRKMRPHFDSAFSAYLYEGPMKDLIHKFKYNRKIALSRLLSNMLSRFVEDDCEVLSGIDMLTFVPMDSKGLRERGFNQSRILAEYISKRFTIPVANTLEKRLGTRRQNELSRSDRLENLNRAFSARIGIDLTGISILLIDDVMTTGATLNECALTLKNSGAAQVRCLTLARPAHSYEDNR